MKTHGDRSRRQSAFFGFTIIELIVIIAVIGILAAVSIIGFGSWRTSVARTEVKSDLLNLKASMEDARNRSDAYPVFTPGTQFDGTNSTRIIFTQSKNVTLTYSSGSASTFCVTAQSQHIPSVSMFINMASSNKAPQDGSC